MTKLTTFENVFNELINNFLGKKVVIFVKQQGLELASYALKIHKIKIEPHNNSYQNNGTNNKQLGLIVIQEKSNHNQIKIPFLLGFNTMQAVFDTKGASIKTLNFTFCIKEQKTKQLKKAW